jgi:hypothetical protein
MGANNTKMNLARAILLNSVDDIHNAIIDGANIDAPFRCDDDVDHCDCFFNAPRAPHERREHFLNLKTPIAIAASRPSVTPQTLLCLLAMGAAREIPGEIPQNQPIALAHSVAKASILLNAGARKGNAYANPDRDVLAFFIGSVGLTNVHTSNVQTAVSRNLKAPTMFLLAAGIGGETDETLANQKGWSLIEPNPMPPLILIANSSNLAASCWRSSCRRSSICASNSFVVASPRSALACNLPTGPLCRR